MSAKAWSVMGLAGWLVACSGVPQPAAPRDALPRRSIVVTQVALHAARPETVLALTNFSVGLLKSHDAGRHWETANRGIRSYSLYRLVQAPRDPDVVYVGAGGGGLYKSTDGAQSFAEKNNGLDNTNIGSIVLHPEHPDHVYVVTSTGVFISRNGADSWTAWNHGDDFTQSQQFQDLVILPGDPETVLLASSRGVWRRLAGDPAWSLASKDLEGRAVTVLVRHPDGRRVFAAALRHGKTLQGGGLFVSEDAGATWSRWDRNERLSLEWIRQLWFDPRSPLAYAATSNSGVLRSMDGGLTWERRDGGLPTPDVRTLAVDSHRPERLYIGTYARGVFVSEDGGGRWRALDQVPALDADTIIAALKVRDPARQPVGLTPPPAFAKCNGCHGWTDPELNQAPRSFWLVPPNRRDWGPTVHRMAPIAGLSSAEEEEVTVFLTAYSSQRQP
jgi:photosystem II stability/assembly factor-like uncharacterized protein